MVKILVVGIGGVGGYFGGLLAQANQDNEELSICFMARGAHLAAIKEHGLHVSKGEAAFVARPALCSDKAEDFGKVDYIILCTKSYDIEATIHQLSSCVKENTVFLPLLNGVDSSEKIKSMFPGHLVADGCAYIIGRLVAPGHIQNQGQYQRIVFGIENETDARLDYLHTAFEKAGIEATLTRSVTSQIWEKFIFISSTAAVSSFHNKTFGQLKACEVCCADLKELVKEICELAAKMQIELPEDIRERTWNRFISLSPEATTSMHSDFIAGKTQTEVNSLLGYVIEKGNYYGTNLSKYREIFEQLAAPHRLVPGALQQKTTY